MSVGYEYVLYFLDLTLEFSALGFSLAPIKCSHSFRFCYSCACILKSMVVVTVLHFILVNIMLHNFDEAYVLQW